MLTVKPDGLFRFPEYFLEDCIQMTQFVPPPMDRKKKDKDEDGGEEEVCFVFVLFTIIIVKIKYGFYAVIDKSY